MELESEEVGMAATLEREVKLRPGPAFAGLELDGMEIPAHVLSSAYVDTDDLRLAAGSVTLRRRRAATTTPCGS